MGKCTNLCCNKVPYLGQEPRYITTFLVRPTQPHPLGISWRSRVWKSWIGHLKTRVWDPKEHLQDQGPVSISEKTSFRKISYSPEAARFVFRIVRSLWNLTGPSAAVLPMCLLNFKTNLVVSRLYEILRKDVFSDIEMGPRWRFLSVTWMILQLQQHNSVGLCSRPGLLWGLLNLGPWYGAYRIAWAVLAARGGHKGHFHWWGPWRPYIHRLNFVSTQVIYHGQNKLNQWLLQVI